MSDRAYAETATWAGKGARIALAASLALLVGGLARSAFAEPGQITWTTYLRAGPGLQYAVIDEIESRTTLDVQECRDGWCRVEYGRAFGYVMAGVITTQASAAPASTPPAAASIPCFQTQQSGYGIGDATQFCVR